MCEFRHTQLTLRTIFQTDDFEKLLFFLFVFALHCVRERKCLHFHKIICPADLFSRMAAEYVIRAEGVKAKTLKDIEKLCLEHVAEDLLYASWLVPFLCMCAWCCACFYSVKVCKNVRARARARTHTHTHTDTHTHTHTRTHTHTHTHIHTYNVSGLVCLFCSFARLL